MKKTPLLLIFTISLFVISGCLSSKQIKIDGYYTSHFQESGDLFFIYKYDDFREINNKSDLSFDVTLQQRQDTVTINYTFFSEEVKSPETLRIEFKEERLSASTEMLFIDFGKNKWEHRYSTKLNYTDFKKFIVSSGLPIISLVLDEENTLLYQTKNRSWEKYTNAVEKVLHIFEEN